MPLSQHFGVEMGVVGMVVFLYAKRHLLSIPRLTKDTERTSGRVRMGVKVASREQSSAPLSLLEIMEGLGAAVSTHLLEVDLITFFKAANACFGSFAAICNGKLSISLSRYFCLADLISRTISFRCLR
ncbi:unnamed protein product [Hymenolepis diminuta]|uniref:Uncharacterized protein n=1 Tax=Hymenolepis diminuta TaxID=6216 RepID=A0A564YTV2_HYMDI|nr:unnamed protein product [Hymenolepis diminuta]